MSSSSIYSPEYLYDFPTFPRTSLINLYSDTLYYYNERLHLLDIFNLNCTLLSYNRSINSDGCDIQFELSSPSLAGSSYYLERSYSSDSRCYLYDMSKLSSSLDWVYVEESSLLSYLCFSPFCYFLCYFTDKYNNRVYGLIYGHEKPSSSRYYLNYTAILQDYTCLGGGFTIQEGWADGLSHFHLVPIASIQDGYLDSC